MTGDVIYIVPLITRRLTRQNEKKKFVLPFFFFYNLFVISIHSVDQQINSQRRRRRLAMLQAGVDKIPDYFRSDTRDVTFLDSGHYMNSNGHYRKIK